MLLPLALSLTVVATPAVQDTAVGTISGVVRSSEGWLIQGAVVEVLDAGRVIQAVTDSLGRYILRGVPAGYRRIRASHFDHEAGAANVLVMARQQMELRFGLTFRQPARLPPVEVRGQARTARDTLAASERGGVTNTVTRAGIEASPGVGELGLARTAKEVPGHEPPDPSDMLLVRGGSAALNLIMLNGAPVVAPFHIGGLIQALDTDVLRSATLHLGGAPARYDGGLSYIMDIETRPGDGARQAARVSFDMLAARTQLEGPLSEYGTYLFNARAIHGLATPFVNDPFPYAYADILSRLDLVVSDSARLSFMGFWNREDLRLDRADDIDQIAEWGNGAGSLRYRTVFRATEVVITGAVSSFNTELPLIGQTPLNTSATSKRARVAGDAMHRFGESASLAFGGSFDRLRIDQRASRLDDQTGASVFSSSSEGDATGGYVEGRVDAGRYIRLRGGLRADNFSVEPGISLAPRLSMAILVGRGNSITMSVGRYRQYALPSIDDAASEADDSDVNTAFSIPSAWHGVTGIDLDLGDGIGFGLEGFYKTFEGLPSETDGTADAAGVDMWLRRFGDRFSGWVGYSLAWVWTSRNEFGTETRVSDGRHLVSLGIQGPFLSRGTFEVSLAYGAGLPYTAIPEPDVTTPVFSIAGTSSANLAEPTPPLPTEPAEPYLRLDAQISHTFESHWRGMRFELTPYLKVLNALDRRDALFYHFDRAANAPDPRPLAPLPVLPLVGLEWRF